MYDINHLVEIETALKNRFKQHFVEFFESFSYVAPKVRAIKLVPIKSHDSISSVLYGTGMYFLLTDFMKDSNPCTLEIAGLKVIYRGHGRRVRKRVESHLFNTRYKTARDGTSYTVCMKINDENGINIDEPPYSESTWAMVQHSMPNSSKTMREQAEQAFDEVYCRPIGSNA